MMLTELAGKRVAVWGLGDEGQSALRALARLYPLPIVTIYTDAPLGHDFIASLPPLALSPAYLHGLQIGQDILQQEFIIKSPGVSLYRPEIMAAQAMGIRITSTVNLWFDAMPAAGARTSPIIAITGTKGKSTSTALLAHLWRKAGFKVLLGGNNRVLLLDTLQEPAHDAYVLELSSYQCANLTGEPDVAVLLNLFPEHQDWHLSHARYYADKMRLIMQAKPERRVLNAKDAMTKQLAGGMQGAVWFQDAAGYHVRDGRIFYRDSAILAAADVPLAGVHHLGNLCAVLTALDLIGVKSRELDLRAALADFVGLPHRIERLGVREQIEYVDDSIATIPEAAMNAVACFVGRPLTLLLGGKDRGQNYTSLASMMAARPQSLVICMHETGARAAEALRAAISQQAASDLRVFQVADLAAAMALAKAETKAGGVVLLSPAAPSYDAFKDFEERGKIFAKLAGF